jgi:hypothetical protein
MNYLRYPQTDTENHNCFVQFEMRENITHLGRQLNQGEKFTTAKANEIRTNEDIVMYGVLVQKF